MNENDILLAKYEQIRILILESMEIEQKILDNSNSHKRHAWLEQLLEKHYEIFKATAERDAMLDAPAPKKPILHKLFRKN